MARRRRRTYFKRKPGYQPYRRFWPGLSGGNNYNYRKRRKRRVRKRTL